jgi:hypothetical protein
MAMQRLHHGNAQTAKINIPGERLCLYGSACRDITPDLTKEK